MDATGHQKPQPRRCARDRATVRRADARSYHRRGMAAIAGCVGLSRGDRIAQLTRALECMAPRGGGETRVWELPSCALAVAFNQGHAQGALIQTHNPEVCIAVDGLIFNEDELSEEFGLQRQTGIDALARLYRLAGPALMQKLDGNFAIALWDEPNSMLILARDDVGSKPLHYAINGSTLLFASDIRGLRRLDDFRVQPDVQAIDDYLTTTYVAPPRTLVAGVTQVRHGQYLAFRQGRMIEECTYIKPATHTFTSGSGEDWSRELERLLLSSVS